MKVTFIRHCESEFNYKLSKNLPLDGLENCGLTKQGFVQAKSLDGSYDIVFLSPMRRCIETFNNSKLEANKILKSSLFREYKKDVCDFFKNEPVMEETEEEILKRVKTIKDELRSYDGQKVCVITHGDLIFYISAKFINDEWFGQYLENGESIELEI